MIDGYYEADRGRFEAALIRESDNTMVAYTECGEIITTADALPSDREAIEAFTEYYSE